MVNFPAWLLRGKIRLMTIKDLKRHLRVKIYESHENQWLALDWIPGDFIKKSYEKVRHGPGCDLGMVAGRMYVGALLEELLRRCGMSRLYPDVIAE